MRNNKIAMATFVAKFRDTINKSKTHDCKYNFSLMMLLSIQILYS